MSFHPVSKTFSLLRGFVRGSFLGAVVVGAAWSMLGGGARANVTGEGDVLPGVFDDEFNVWIITLPRNGGDFDGDVVVGGTGVVETGTVVGRLVVDLPGVTDPLFSNNGYIGGADPDDDEIGWDGMGEVVVTGLGSEWSVDERMVVGVNGTGYLTLSQGAIMRTNLADDSSPADPDFSVGENPGAQGFVTITGFGTRLVGSELSVGRRGFGSVEVLARARIETQGEAIIGDIATASGSAFGTGHMILQSPGTRWNIGEVNPGADFDGPGTLTVGRQGRGLLEIYTGAMTAVRSDVRIGSLTVGSRQSFGQVYVSDRDSMLWTQARLFVGSATSAAAGELHLDNFGVARADTSVTVSPRGLIELAGGTLLTPTLSNSGVIRGFGRVDAPSVTNNGQIRNAAREANLREYLRVTGAVTNNGDIESNGGEIEFDSLVTNNGPGGDIVGVDAILRFNGGLVGDGNVFLDNTVVWTPGVFAPAGVLSIEATTSKLVGTLELATTSIMLVEIGDDYSRFEISAGAALDGTLSLALGSSYIPRAGDSFEILEANGGVTGDFDVFSAPSLSGLTFDYTLTANSVIINVGAGFVFSADFNGDGIVDGADLAIWRMNMGLTPATPADGDANGDGIVDGADFLIWSRTLGPVPAVAAAGAVPEPGAAGMALVAAALGWRARRRRAA